jgi:DNA modification methylase
MLEINKIHQGDSLELLKKLDDKFIQCQICSPAYYNLRNYLPSEHSLKEKEFGCFSTPEEYIDKLCDIFDEVYRVLKDNGICFVNLGDSYLGSGKGVWDKDNNHKENFKFEQKPKELLGGWRKPKQLAMIPSRFAIEMQNRNWILRNKIIWHKPNAMPSSVKDRFIVDYEEIFMFVKNIKYKFNKQFEPYTKPMNRWGGINLKKREETHSSWDKGTGQTTYRTRSMRPNPNGKGKRCVWTINTKPLKSSHCAIFPEKLVEPMILSGSDEGDLVLDIFSGSGTTGVVALKNKRNFLLFELNKEYCEIAKSRLSII